MVNLTRFRTQTLPFRGVQGVAAYSVIVKATCDLKTSGIVTLSDKQLPLANGDTYVGDSEEPTVQYESDFVPFKPRADCLCIGSARSCWKAGS